MSLQLPVSANGAELAAILRSVGSDSSFISWLPFLGGSMARRDPVELDDPYLREAWISACVDMRCAVVGGLPLRIYDRDPDDEAAVEVTSGQLFDLLKHPMEGLDSTLFHILMSQQIDLAGESLLFLRDKAGNPIGSIGDSSDAPIETPAEIIPVRGDMVKLQTDPSTGYPLLWTAGGGTRTLSYPPASVVNVFDTMDPDRAPWRGIGRIAKCWGYAAQNYLARRYQSHLLANNGTPAGVITIETAAALHPDVRRAAEAEADAAWNSPAKAGKTRLLFSPAGAKASYQPSIVAPKDMEYGKLLEANKEDIASIFQTPPALLGQHQDNYATFAGHMRMFLALRAQPFLRMVQEALNNRFIARLRDTSLNKLRVRFDTESVDAAFANIEEHAQKAKALRDLGLPIAVALRESGIKVEPFPGDELALVPAGYEPLDMAVLTAKAAAAIQLQEAGVEGQQALEEAGLGHLTYVEPPPPPPMAAPGAPGEPPKSAPPSAAAPPETPPKLAPPAVERAQAAARKDHFANRANRTEEWLRLERFQASARRKVRDACRKTFSAMKKAQLEALRSYAATGEAKTVRELEGLGPASALYRGPTPYMPPAAARGLLAAIQADRDEPTMETQRCGCCGEREDDVVTQLWPHVEAWAKRYPGLARHGLARARDVALLSRAVLTESQIDELLVAQDKKWAAALAEKLGPILLAQFEDAAQDIAKQLGVAVIDLTQPAILRKVAERAIQVAEGSTSAVAKRLRSEIISILSEHTDLPSLQAAVKESLDELAATTAHVFNVGMARSLTIARTEVGIATESARWDTLEGLFTQGTIAGMRWLTSGQPPEPIGTTRLWHFSMDGQVSVPGIGFTDGLGNVLRFPLDPTAPPETIINCRCHVVAVPIE